MHDSRVVVFDSGRASLWFRIPALLFGLAAGSFGVVLAVEAIRGTVPAKASGSPLLGCLALLLISALWILVWFVQLRLVVMQPSRDILIQTRSYFGWHERRVATTGAVAVRIERVRNGIASTTWRMFLEQPNRADKTVTDLGHPANIEFLAQNLSAELSLPVLTRDLAS